MLQHRADICGRTMLQADGSSQSNILSPMPLHGEAGAQLAALPLGPTAVSGPHAPKPAVRGRQHSGAGQQLSYTGIQSGPDATLCVKQKQSPNSTPASV